ncbi:protein NRT1/ PTR FAMILY 5.5-like [Humulus lupulus]|uniref:protein NRT1/ PTR FAMILY 5.5-like n=1 Tax=Humulus lupulus TaxID=3486 RepID=UPI002B405BAB|nr:protein NRT1/ PTR FAMILY 5.5-like [Humulus lupulus]
MRSFVWIKIKGLTWSDKLSEYVLWLMALFLTEVWQLNYKTAVTGVNIFRGLEDIAPLTLQHVVDSYLGNYGMAFLSSVAYTGGLVFLSLSALGTCNTVGKNSCHVKKRYKFLFFLALPQLLVGISFHKLNSLEELLSEVECLKPSKRLRLINIVAWIVVNLAGTFVLSRIDIWTLRFAIPTMCMLVATLFFWSCSVHNSIKRHDPPGSFLTTMRRVIVPSFYLRSTEPNQGYDNTRTRYGRRLRCLDKAIINLPNNADQEQRNRVIRDVEEVKKFICRIPFCMAFFVLGIVSSVGDTYFIQQAANMDFKEYEAPIVVLQLWYELSKKLISKLYMKIMQKLLKNNSRSNNNNSNNSNSSVHNLFSSKYAGCVGVAVSMIFAMLCCFTAANVEKHRLDKVKDMYDKHGTASDGIIPMSMFWLLPQFFLLGSFDGILDESIDLFCNTHEAPTSSDRVMRVFSLLIIGLGKIGSILSVFVARKASAWVGKTSWFEEDLNKSRLDKYYWVLAALSIANLVYYNILYYCTSLRSEVRESY